MSATIRPFRICFGVMIGGAKSDRPLSIMLQGCPRAPSRFHLGAWRVACYHDRSKLGGLGRGQWPRCTGMALAVIESQWHNLDAAHPLGASVVSAACLGTPRRSKLQVTCQCPSLPGDTGHAPLLVPPRLPASTAPANGLGTEAGTAKAHPQQAPAASSQSRSLGLRGRAVLEGLSCQLIARRPLVKGLAFDTGICARTVPMRLRYIRQ